MGRDGDRERWKKKGKQRNNLEVRREEMEGGSKARKQEGEGRMEEGKKGV